MPSARTSVRVIAILVYPEFQLLDATGPAEVFAMAHALSAAPAYEVRVVSGSGGPVASSSGVALHTEPVDALAPEAVDTLLVAGGERAGLVEAAQNVQLQNWAGQSRVHARRAASVCTGAFLLAHWGWLDGRRATTHWASANLLAQSFGSVDVEPDCLFIEDGGTWTSGGITAGIDMGLAMVEQDAGRWLASRVARQLNLAVRRPGNQSQYSTVLHGQAGRYADLVDWLRAHLAEPMTVERMAQVAGQSPRTFHRRFVQETGLTPRAFMETLRLEAVRAALEEGATVKAAAHAVGFGSGSHLDKAFRRRFGLTPSQLRVGGRPR